MSQVSKNIERKAISFALIGFIFYLLVLFIEFPSFLDANTHLFIHTLMELTSIIISAVIFLYGWLTWSYTKSRILIFISASFLSVGILDIFHTLLFDGFPFSTSPEPSTWFWIIGSLTEIVGISIVFFLVKTSSNLYSKSNRERCILTASSLLYSLGIASIIILFSGSLPPLISEMGGTTSFKNNIEYSISLFHLTGIIYTSFLYYRKKNEFYLYLLLSFYFLMLCSLTVTIYTNVHDIIHILGHFYKIFGYYFILRAFYLTNIRVPFEEKKITEEELQDTKEEFKNIILQNQGIIIKLVKRDDEFIHTLCDGKLLSDLKLTQDQIVGHSVHHFLRKEVADQLHREFERVWYKGDDLGIEFEIYEDVFLLMTLTRVTPFGKPPELIGNIVDISELKQAEALLRKTEKLSIVGELAAGFAHEIRNPLTTIKGFLQLMSKNEDPTNKKYTSIMLEEIDRLEMITSEFMVVAKPEATKYQTIELIKILEDVIAFLTPQALLKNVQIQFDTVINHVNVYGDEHHLKQVLINVYKNAMEAMPTGGNISTNLTIEDNYIAIEIIDEGCGIPEELMPRLGEPFYTLKEKGTGLGLMVSYKIIEAHKGKLEISSELNVGTTVKMKLPI